MPTLPPDPTPPDADELQPDMRAFQQRLAAAYAAHPPLDAVSLAEARRIVEAVRAPLAAGGPAMARSRDLAIDVPGHGALPLRLHEPAEGRDRPALVYLHGGGWMYFSLDSHDRLMRELAARSGRVVAGVGYALAPEARFPVALEQTVAAFRWLAAQAAELGLDAGRIALGGDSAGANLALAAALDLRDAGPAPRPDALLLHYGAYSDDDHSASSIRYDGPGYVLGREEMRGFWRAYLRNEADRDDPRAMPLKADLRGLPRCALVVAECDVLRDSSLALAAALQAAGVPVALQRHPGAPHSFLEAMSFAETAQRALAQGAAWLRDGT